MIRPDILTLIVAGSPAVLAAVLSHIARKEITRLEITMNHRLDDLLASEKAKALLIGEAVGVAKEAARALAAAKVRSEAESLVVVPKE